MFNKYPQIMGVSETLNFPKPLILTALTASLVACHSGSNEPPKRQNTGVTSARCKPTKMELRVFDLHNGLRQTGQICGNSPKISSHSLRWSCALYQAAHEHSQTMSEQKTLSHLGKQGAKLGYRVDVAGYAWSAIGENIASGHRTAIAAHQAWVASASHCKNIMNSDYTDAAVARVGDYWTVIFARPL